ncbi:hypothetical protein Misp06_00272 [Microbulbifer sp. NBRC 101763]
MHIGVAVVALDRSHPINQRICGDKAGQGRVVDPSVHMDQAHLIQHFMAGINEVLFKRFKLLETFDDQDKDTVIRVIDAIIAQRQVEHAMRPLER